MSNDLYGLIYWTYFDALATVINATGDIVVPVLLIALTALIARVMWRTIAGRRSTP